MSAAAVEPAGTYVFDGVACHLGEKMSREQLDALPVGAVIADPTGTKIVKDADGRSVQDRCWSYGGRRVNPSSDYNILFSVPGPQAPPPPERRETVARYRRRFAEFVLTKVADLAEVHQDSARKVLTELGLLVGDFTVGSRVTRHTVPPEGTVATYGGPDQHEFTVFRFDDRWVKVSGYWDSLAYAGEATVCYVPNDAFAEVGGDQQALIADFNAWVWGKAQELKPAYKWCSALEKILTEFGIPNPDVLPDLSNWPTIIADRDERAELANGAVLAASDGDWGIFVKVGEDDKTGKGWRRVAGTRPKGRGPMHLLFDGNGELRIYSAGPLLDFVPAGARVLRGGVASVYTKQADGRWSRNSDGHTRSSEAMRGNSLTLVSF